MRLPRLTLQVAGAVVALDALSKLLVAHLLSAGVVVHAGPLVEFDLYYNHAGAGNTLEGRSLLVSVLAVLAVLGIAFLAGRARTRGNALGLGLLLGGGIGNLLDRLFGAPGPLRGGVIDWIRLFGGQGSMNLADLSINLGLIVLVSVMLYACWSDARRAREGRSEVTAPL
jgi:signal peptidase II